MQTSHKRDSGAAIVEFAIVLPLLLALVFGTIEYGFFMAQHLEVRHASREGARLAAVDFGTLSEISSATCDRLEVSTGQAEIRLFKTGSAIGQVARVRVSRPTTSVTGLYDAILPANVVSEVEMRLEARANWVAGTWTCP